MIRRVVRPDGMIEWAGPHGGRVVVREQLAYGDMVGLFVGVPWGALDFVDLMNHALLWKEVMGLKHIMIETSSLKQLQALRVHGYALTTESVISAVQLTAPQPAQEAAAYALPQAEEVMQEIEEEVEEETPPPPPRKVARRRVAPAPAPVQDHQQERPQPARKQVGILSFAQNPRLQPGPVLGGVE